jgi:hypothetical protein
MLPLDSTCYDANHKGAACGKSVSPTKGHVTHDPPVWLQIAASLRAGAAALTSDGSDGKLANAVDQGTYERMGGSPNGAAFVPVNGPIMTVNLGNTAAWANSGGLKWVVGHESLHTGGLRDQTGANGAIAYKHSGNPQERAAFDQLTGTPAAAVNPDHLINGVYPHHEPH